jgi:hypothetical protein
MPSQHKTTPLGTRLPEAERQAVKDDAERQGIKVNEWLRRAIREKLARGAASCPGCGTPGVVPYDVTNASDRAIAWRECPDCGRKWTTQEGN